MKRMNQKLVRAAVLLHERLAGKQRREGTIYLPTYAWTAILDIQRQIDKARLRGWYGAVKRLNEDLACTVADCSRQLDETRRHLKDANRTPCHKVSVADVYRDLLALRSEFADLDIDLKANEVAVTTDTITLEDVLLGRFQIRLDWNCIGRTRQPYRVIALDPHPAAKNEDVTHPHVQDEHLCEGEGQAAIAAALAEGRLYDFFLLVSQVLHTYGRGSAYVELDRWQNVPCDDCGNSIEPDERNYCHRCDATLCGECSYPCQGCDESFCSGCLNRCSVCGREYCWACLSACSACGKQCCDNCCNERSLCRRCHDKQHKEPEDDSTTDLEREAIATLA